MHKLIVLTSPDISVGFKLAGVEVIEAETGDEARGKLAPLLNDDSVGVIAIDETFFARVDERTKELIEKSYRPVVISIPSKTTMASRENRAEYVARMIRRAIGYNITLRR